MELNKLQTPLYAFYNSLNVASPPSPVGGIGNKENVSSICNLPPKSRSPNKMASRRFSTALDVEYSSSPRNFSRRASNIGVDVNFRVSQGGKELPFDYQPEPLTPRYAISCCISYAISCSPSHFDTKKQCLHVALGSVIYKGNGKKNLMKSLKEPEASSV